MTDDDIDAKFRDLSADILGSARAETALHALWRLEEAERIGPVLDLVTVNR
jgi:hypothetical protein